MAVAGAAAGAEVAVGAVVGAAAGVGAAAWVGGAVVGAAALGAEDAGAAVGEGGALDEHAASSTLVKPTVVAERKARRETRRDPNRSIRELLPFAVRAKLSNNQLCLFNLIQQ